MSANLIFWGKCDTFGCTGTIAAEELMDAHYYPWFDQRHRDSALLSQLMLQYATVHLY